MKKTNELKGPLLLVEDDIIDQVLFKKAMSVLRITYELIVANNGEEALTILRSDVVPPFIIISDINMPRMNGLELAREILKDEKLRSKSIPFVFMSSSASPEEVKQAYDLCVQGYFEKSLDYNSLKNNLSMIIGYWERSHSKSNP